MAAKGSDTGEKALWTKNIRNLPQFSGKQIEKHLQGCGKSEIGAKGYKFYTENYIHDVYVQNEYEQQAGPQGQLSVKFATIKCLCHRSQKKNEAPHKLLLKVKPDDNGEAEIMSPFCSCAAGTGGHCHHIFALLYLLNHWNLLQRTDIPADKTCTSLPQSWHVPRGDKIQPEPVLKCIFSQARPEKRKRPPVASKLYDPRSKKLKKEGWGRRTILSLCSGLKKEEKPPPFSYLLSDVEVSSVRNTIFGNVPLGSYLGYQLLDKNNKKTLFYLDRPAEKMCIDNPQNAVILPFPDLPQNSSTAFNLPTNIEQGQSDILKKITVNITQSQNIEKITVQQSLEPEWFAQRKLRLTASNFGKVLQRKKAPTEVFISNIFQPKDLSKMSSIKHGRQNEIVARSLYSRKMQKKCKQFVVYDAGLVINPTFPYLGASPDGKVCDPTEQDPYGLLEIKNPYTWRNNTIHEACADTRFYLHMVDNKPKLKQDDKGGYYAQVQGQLAITGLQWCDFVIQLTGSHTLNVERIYFNKPYWEQNLFPKMHQFYFNHALPCLAKLSAP